MPGPRPVLRTPHALPALSLLAWICCLGALGCATPEPEQPPPARVPVTVEVLEPQAFQPTLRLLGRVEPAARFELRPEAAGTVRYEPRFRGGLRTGETVRAGEALFRVDDPSARLRLVEAELEAEAAEADLERSNLGVTSGFVSTAEHAKTEILARLARERLENARRDVERLQVRAPVAGVLRVERRVAPGAQVDPGTLLGEVAADGALRVEAWAAVEDLESLADLRATGAGAADAAATAATAATAEVELLDPASRRVVGRGTVAEAAASVDDGGVGRVVVQVADDLGMPRVGDGVEVRVLLPRRDDALTVPEKSLLVQGSIATVFVLEPSADAFQAESRLVVAGGRHDGRVEILDGLRAGERVAVEGAELLADGLLAEDADRERKPWE